MTVQCTQPECTASTEHPYRHGWSHLTDFPEGVQDGFYCPRHARQLEWRHYGRSPIDTIDGAKDSER